MNPKNIFISNDIYIDQTDGYILSLVFGFSSSFTDFKIPIEQIIKAHVRTSPRE